MFTPFSTNNLFLEYKSDLAKDIAEETSGDLKRALLILLEVLHQITISLNINPLHVLSHRQLGNLFTTIEKVHTNFTKVYHPQEWIIMLWMT